MITVVSAPADPSLPDSSEGKRILALLPPATRTRLAGLKYAEDLSRSLTAYSLLYHHLADFYDVSLESIVVEDGLHGKPELKVPGGVCFNCAHAEQWCVCAISAYPVGVDIERYTPVVDASLYVCLHSREFGYIQKIPEDRQNREFLNLWTMKEAYLKALGCGLLREPSTFAVICSDQGEVYIEDPFKPPGIYPRLFRRKDVPGFSLAACILVPYSERSA
ncbi:4'-phosphopantetheinyl transferase superfamily protein [Marispirochaeta sp.]|uniref:4'-phosphopantetheinyl transferase family protein n=1 Tax=Marispirochaeta sp. TaxID=2038653 RepID=UPI0029C6A595|nr:4'-phosphopantetheinyl transferase superfamily protein [Marispirochaeta sp.]